MFAFSKIKEVADHYLYFRPVRDYLRQQLTSLVDKSSNKMVSVGSLSNATAADALILVAAHMDELVYDQRNLKLTELSCCTNRRLNQTGRQQPTLRTLT